MSKTFIPVHEIRVIDHSDEPQPTVEIHIEGAPATEGLTLLRFDAPDDHILPKPESAGHEPERERQMCIGDFAAHDPWLDDPVLPSV